MDVEAFNRELIDKVTDADPEQLRPRRRIHVRGWKMSRRHREALSDILSTPGGLVRSRVRFGQGKMRLIMPAIPEGGDPLAEWKSWGRRVEQGLGAGRIPGTWKTRRGSLKRMCWLVINFGGY